MVQTLRKKAVIFDMDGTLVDNMQFHAMAWVRYLATKNIQCSVQDMEVGLKNQAGDYIKPMLGDMPERDFLRLEDEKECIYRDIYKQHASGIDGITDFLHLLKSHQIKVGLATLGNRENVHFTLGALHIAHFFNDIKQSEDVEKRKPHPEIYLKSLASLGISAQEALVFEDSEPGIRSAHSAGIDVVGIESSHNGEKLKSWGASYAVKNYTQFMQEYTLV